MADLRQAAQVVLRGDVRDLRQKLRTVGADLEQLGSRWERAMQVSQRAGRVMTAASGAVMAGLAAATREAAKFEKGIAEVSTLVDTTQVDMKQFADGVKDLAMRTGQGLDVLTKGLYDTISAGIEAADALEFLDTAARIAVGGVTDVATSVDLLTTITNAYGLAAEDANRIADELFMTVRLGKTTIGELAGAMQYVAATASGAGVSTQEMLAALAALTTQGFRTTTAAQSLNQVMMQLIRPQEQAVKVAAQLGIELGAEALAAQGLAGVLADIREKTAGNVEVMARLFGSVEALRAVMALTGAGFTTFNSNLEQMRRSAGAADEAFSKMAETTAQQYAQLRQELQVAAVEIGSALLPVANSVAKDLMPQLKQLTQWLRENPEAVRAFGDAMAGVFVTGVVLQASASVTTLVANLKALGVTLGGLRALAGVGGPVTLLATGIAAIGAAALKTMHDIEKLAQATEARMSDAVRPQITMTAQLLERLGQEADNAFIRDAYERAATDLRNIAQNTANAEDAMRQAVLRANDLANELDDLGAADTDVDRLRRRVDLLKKSFDNLASSASATRIAVYGAVRAAQQRVPAGPPPPARGTVPERGAVTTVPGYRERVHAGAIEWAAPPFARGMQALDVLLGEYLPRMSDAYRLLTAQTERQAEREAEIERLRRKDRLTAAEEQALRELEREADLGRAAIERTREGIRALGEGVRVYTAILSETGDAALQAVADSIQRLQTLSVADPRTVAEFYRNLSEQMRVLAGTVLTAPEMRQMFRSIEEWATAERPSWAEVAARVVAELLPRLRELESARALAGEAQELASEFAETLEQARRARELQGLFTPVIGEPPRERIGGVVGPIVPEARAAERQALTALEPRTTMPRRVLPEPDLTIWEEWAETLRDEWDRAMIDISDRFVESISSMLLRGRLEFDRFAEYVGRVMTEAAVAQLASIVVTGEGKVSAGTVGSVLGALLGGAEGAALGGALGWLGGLIGLYDDPLNDIAARQSARDFAREFTRGAAEAGAQPRGIPRVVVQQNGTYIYAYPTDADTEAARIARYLERRAR